MNLAHHVESYRFCDIVTQWAWESLKHEIVIARALAKAVVVPGWMAYTLHADEDLVVFSYSDRVAQEKLGLFREQRM